MGAFWTLGGGVGVEVGCTPADAAGAGWAAFSECLVGTLLLAVSFSLCPCLLLPVDKRDLCWSSPPRTFSARSRLRRFFFLRRRRRSALDSEKESLSSALLYSLRRLCFRLFLLRLRSLRCLLFGSERRLCRSSEADDTEKDGEESATTFSASSSGSSLESPIASTALILWVGWWLNSGKDGMVVGMVR